MKKSFLLLFIAFFTMILGLKATDEYMDEDGEMGSVRQYNAHPRQKNNWFNVDRDEIQLMAAVTSFSRYQNDPENRTYFDITLRVHEYTINDYLQRNKPVPVNASARLDRLRLKAQQDQNATLRATIVDQNTTIAVQKTKIENQKTKIKDQDKTINEQNATFSKQLDRVIDQNLEYGTQAEQFYNLSSENTRKIKEDTEVIRTKVHNGMPEEVDDVCGKFRALYRGGEAAWKLRNMFLVGATILSWKYSHLLPSYQTVSVLPEIEAWVPLLLTTGVSIDPSVIPRGFNYLFDKCKRRTTL